MGIAQTKFSMKGSILMTIEFKNETMAEVKAMAEAYLEKADNAELAQDKADNESAIEQCINRYKFLSKTACYAEAKASGDPLRYAVMQFYYPTIKLKATADKDSGIIIRSIIDAQSGVDVTKKKIRMRIRPGKLLVFDKQTEERLYGRK